MVICRRIFGLYLFFSFSFRLKSYQGLKVFIGQHVLLALKTPDSGRQPKNENKKDNQVMILIHTLFNRKGEKTD
jgi:hypothetical protein